MTWSPGFRSPVPRRVAGMTSSGTRSAFSTARSCCGSALISDARDSVPSWKRTLTFFAPATTCKLVRITPLSVTITPVPPLVGCGLPSGGSDLFHFATDVHDRARNNLIGLDRERWQRRLLERVPHRAVDVELGQTLRGRAQRALGRHRRERDLAPTSIIEIAWWRWSSRRRRPGGRVGAASGAPATGGPAGAGLAASADGRSGLDRPDLLYSAVRFMGSGSNFRADRTTVALPLRAARHRRLRCKDSRAAGAAPHRAGSVRCRRPHRADGARRGRPGLPAPLQAASNCRSTNGRMPPCL